MRFALRCLLTVLYVARPTFIFLKGSTKVDEVRGANRAYVLHWSLRSLVLMAMGIEDSSLPYASTHPGRPPPLRFTARVRRWVDRLLPLPHWDFQTLGASSANWILKQRSCLVCSVLILSSGCLAECRIPTSIIWILYS